ncbi:MAG: hypothetical protein K2F82_07495 [Muribaculaceae bacterium]|nr:hypothetical protein [Muribaculaceae bacterium]MDE6316486.1 hypothetical protein [Muribaculaceae bacterium]
MKKFMLLLMTLCITLGASATELTKQQQKQINKETKAKLKEYKKEGWKIFGSSSTLEGALNKHYTTLISMAEDGHEVVGVAGNFKSKNIGHQQAVNNACVNYSNEAGSTLKGRVVSDMAANGSDESAAEEFDHFYAAYERLVEKEIKNEMSESFSIIRDMGNGVFEMQTFFIVNESAASKARIRAMENALKESEAAQRHASSISDFVRKGF